ncbi:MAG: 2Fe-2S iron-sulfur cluster-binding protein [Halobacteriaceae archaeon]
MKLTLEWRNGRQATVSGSPEESILEAAEAAGVGVPFGCRTGACATCTGRLLEGTVEHRRPVRALKSRHRAANYILLCIAEPRSDCRIEVGKDVQAELLSNPWQ